MSSTDSLSMGTESISQETCPICYEDFDLESGTIRPLEDTRCGHSFCVYCLKEHCFLSISERIVPIPCPNHTCKDVLSDDFVKTVMREYTNAAGAEKDDDGDSGSRTMIAMREEECDKAWIKYLCWKLLASDPSLMTCPRCDRLVAPPGGGGRAADRDNHNNNTEPEEQQTARYCTACSHSFCSVHGDSHPDLTCQEFTMTPEMRQSEEVLQQRTKPCTQCGARLQKKSGCDHIMCPACRTHMCWKCGTHVYMDGLHCNMCGRHYGGRHHERLPESHWGLVRACLGDCLLIVGLVFLAIAWCLVGMLLCVLTGFCCCFYCCGPQIHPHLKSRPRRFGRVRLVFIWAMLPVAIALDFFNILDIPELYEMDPGYSVEIPVLPVVRRDAGEE